METRAFHTYFEGRPAFLAPMEDVSDAVFRRLCRARGADLCFTEFVNVEGMLRGCKRAARKLLLEQSDAPTVIQIYGADAPRLAEAAAVAEASNPAWIDINCGCWVPKIAGRGAGAGWLRDPEAMVAMAAMVVKSVSLPVTIKTRIGWGPESHMPIIDLAKRLEDVGVSAITVHCRTAQMGHSGNADWSWAGRAKEVVKIPVVVNGDIKSAQDAARALSDTGCDAVMIGRRAIDHPWVFREIRSFFATGTATPPTAQERLSTCREHLIENAAQRTEVPGVRCTRRYFSGYLKGLPQGAALRRRLLVCDSLQGCLDMLHEYEQALNAGRIEPEPKEAA